MQNVSIGQMERIYLTGFMGSGKSSVGRLLAHNMKMQFVDLDELIVKACQQSINEIFSLQGEAYFREIERRFLHATREYSRAVIATGGGTPCFHNNMQWIKENGLSIYLEVSPALLSARLLNEQASRPLLSSLSEEELHTYVRQKLSEREPYYRQADICYEQKNQQPEAIAAELALHFEEITGH
jgi:shikimate kinase